MDAAQGPRFLSIQDVCNRVGVARHTVVRVIKKGQLRAHRFAGRWRISEDDLREYMRRNADEYLASRTT